MSAQNKFRTGDDTKYLRRILGQFATGVAIVTAQKDDGQPCGITINSLTSVSLDPPLLLFCLSKTSGTLPVFQQSEKFAINILDGEQKQLSQDFARINYDKFANVIWKKGENDCPIFPFNIATIECTKVNEFDGGDHRIFLGKIDFAHGHESYDPLIYHAGNYKKIHI